MTAVADQSAKTKSQAINPWIIAVVVTLATFMELLDTAIANVSLPHIAGGLGRSFDETTWVITSYLVANAVVLPLSAWLSRVLGRKRYYMISVGLFTAASCLCGLAPNLGFLVVARVIQGLSGGGLAPVEQAILVDTFPAHKRAGAFALYSMAIVTAPALGPPLGGWITDSFSWRWVFFINIPIGIISLILSSRVIHDSEAFKEEVKAAKSAGKLQVDYVGIGMIALGFACLEFALDRGQIDDWFGSSTITAAVFIALGTLTFALWWEWRHPNPVVELRLLRERNFAFSVVFYFLFGIALFGSTTMIPEVLQSLYGYTATDAGLVLGPGALVVTILSPFVARITQRGMIAPRWMIAFSFTVVGLSMLYYSSFNLQTDYFHYALARGVQGFGYAFLFVPVSVMAYSYLPANMNNKASSLTNLARNWGGSVGVAFITTMHERRTDLRQNVIGAAIAPSNPILQQRLRALTLFFEQHGAAPPDALHRAQGLLYRELGDHASLLAFMDNFRYLALVCVIGIPLTFFTRSFAPARKGGGGH